MTFGESCNQHLKPICLRCLRVRRLAMIASSEGELTADNWANLMWGRGSGAFTPNKTCEVTAFVRTNWWRGPRQKNRKPRKQFRAKTSANTGHVCSVFGLFVALARKLGAKKPRKECDASQAHTSQAQNHLLKSSSSPLRAAQRKVYPAPTMVPYRTILSVNQGLESRIV